MPIMIKKDNFIDIFENIIDLPLVTKILELIDYLKNNGVNVREDDILNKPYDKLIHFFLMNSTVTILSPFLDEEKIKYMGQLYRNLPSFIKEKIVCDNLNEVLKIFFELIQKIDNNQKKVELLKVTLKRYSRLFIDNEIKIEVKPHILKFIELQIKTYPQTLRILYDSIKATIFELDNIENEELILHLIYIISETFEMINTEQTQASKWNEVILKFDRYR